VQAVDPEGALSALLPRERAVGMVVYLGATLVKPGVVAVRPEAGLVVGEPSGENTPRLRAIAAALERAGFPVRVTADIRTELWTKLMGNVAFNQISLLTRAGLGTIALDPPVRRIVAAMMAETVEIARATGADPTISIEDRLAITERLGDHKPSTLQDLEAGKRLELDAIAAAVVELADVADIDAPTVRIVTALADLEARQLGLR
jgi:2-dehydropantoate 2-reductase